MLQQPANIGETIHAIYCRREVRAGMLAACCDDQLCLEIVAQKRLELYDKKDCFATRAAAQHALLEMRHAELQAINKQIGELLAQVAETALASPRPQAPAETPDSAR